MPASQKAVLFIDFDNTISRGDVLDAVIEAFSPGVDWRDWQTAWEKGSLSTFECLRRQVAGIRVERDTLLDFVRDVDIDPDFIRLQDWAAETGTEMIVVSDNFDLIVAEIFRRHGVAAPPIFANGMAFDGNRIAASFPYRNPACPRCAHCKSVHLPRYAGLRTIYVGDGGSDICPAERADQVFAKDSLAAYLLARGRPFIGFDNLGDVLARLATDATAPAGAMRS